jgi:hypothetical protein
VDELACRKSFPCSSKLFLNIFKTVTHLGFLVKMIRFRVCESRITQARADHNFSMKDSQNVKCQPRRHYWPTRNVAASC